MPRQGRSGGQSRDRTWYLKNYEKEVVRCQEMLEKLETFLNERGRLKRRGFDSYPTPNLKTPGDLIFKVWNKMVTSTSWQKLSKHSLYTDKAGAYEMEDFNISKIGAIARASKDMVEGTEVFETVGQFWEHVSNAIKTMEELYEGNGDWKDLIDACKTHRTLKAYQFFKKYEPLLKPWNQLTLCLPKVMSYASQLDIECLLINAKDEIKEIRSRLYSMEDTLDAAGRTVQSAKVPHASKLLKRWNKSCENARIQKKRRVGRRGEAEREDNKEELERPRPRSARGVAGGGSGGSGRRREGGHTRVERDEKEEELRRVGRPRRVEEREGGGNHNIREERGRRRGRDEISGSTRGLQNMLENPQGGAGGSQAPGFDDLQDLESHRPRRRRHNGDLRAS